MNSRSPTCTKGDARQSEIKFRALSAQVTWSLSAILELLHLFRLPAGVVGDALPPRSTPGLRNVCHVYNVCFFPVYGIEVRKSLDLTFQVSIVVTEILSIGALPLKGYPPLKAHLADALDSKCAWEKAYHSKKKVS